MSSGTDQHGGDGEGSSSARLVVIAASAGALPAIIDVLAPLPADFPAAIALVQHRGPAEPQVLVDLLARRTRLRVRHAQDGALLESGTVYVCPPGVHMTSEHCVRLIDGPRLRFVQPNADLMFASVARTEHVRMTVTDTGQGIVPTSCRTCSNGCARIPERRLQGTTGSASGCRSPTSSWSCTAGRAAPTARGSIRARRSRSTCRRPPASHTWGDQLRARTGHTVSSAHRDHVASPCV